MVSMMLYQCLCQLPNDLKTLSDGRILSEVIRFNPQRLDVRDPEAPGRGYPGVQMPDAAEFSAW